MAGGWVTLKENLMCRVWSHPHTLQRKSVARCCTYRAQISAIVKTYVAITAFFPLQTNGGGSNQSGSSSSGVSSAAVSSRVSPYSFASSQTSAGSDVSSVSGSSLGGEQHDRTTPAWQTRFQQTINCSRSVSAKQQTIPGRLKMQTVQGSENGKDKPAQPRLSQVDGPQSKSNPNSPPLKQQRPRPAVSDRKDDFLLSPKPSLPARIQRSDKKERPRSAPSSPLPSRRGNNPTGSFTDMQKKFEHGPHLEDTHTSKCGAPNLRPLVLNPKTPENPITEKSSSLLSSPLFKRRAAAVSSTAQHKEEKGRCKDESAATQPSLSSKQPANHEQKVQAVHDLMSLNSVLGLCDCMVCSGELYITTLQLMTVNCP